MLTFPPPVYSAVRRRASGGRLRAYEIMDVDKCSLILFGPGMIVMGMGSPEQLSPMKSFDRLSANGSTISPLRQ